MIAKSNFLRGDYDNLAVELDIFIADLQKEEDFKLKYISNGWQKPHKQLIPFIRSKINFNLRRNRIREKKQIFLKVA
jgi:hypothetical protein